MNLHRHYNGILLFAHAAGQSRFLGHDTPLSILNHLRRPSGAFDLPQRLTRGNTAEKASHHSYGQRL
ncbi:MAG: hypothetical protein MK165_14880 [Pirellulaceae bacterium]|nr:hypothetical protein [Pirellulaceae bacterium]